MAQSLRITMESLVSSGSRRRPLLSRSWRRSSPSLASCKVKSPRLTTPKLSSMSTGSPLSTTWMTRRRLKRCLIYQSSIRTNPSNRSLWQWTWEIPTLTHTNPLTSYLSAATVASNHVGIAPCSSTLMPPYGSWLRPSSVSKASKKMVISIVWIETTSRLSKRAFRTGKIMKARTHRQSRLRKSRVLPASKTPHQMKKITWLLMRLRRSQGMTQPDTWPSNWRLCLSKKPSRSQWLTCHPKCLVMMVILEIGSREKDKQAPTPRSKTVLRLSENLRSSMRKTLGTATNARTTFKQQRRLRSTRHHLSWCFACNASNRTISTSRTSWMTKLITLWKTSTSPRILWAQRTA